VLSTVIGFVLALMRLSPYMLLRAPATTFITIIRGIPIIVQLFYIYFVFPDIGITVNAFQAGAIGLGIAYSAYQAENFRAGIEAIDHGQIEAAQSIGMRYWLVLRRVIMPQAIRISLPPYGNTMIMMLKDSSIASTITVAELTRQGQLIAASTFKNMTVFTLVALLYLTMSLPLTYLAYRLEKKFARK
jgi:polar amino acid transport system permease protein